MPNRKNTDFIDELNKEFAQEAEDQREENTTQEKEIFEKKAKSENFAQLFESSLRKPSQKLCVGDKIRGKILVLGKEDVFVGIGSHQEGIIAKRDLLDENGHCPYKTDDIIDLYVIQIRRDEIRLSKKPTDKGIVEDLEDAFDMMLPVQGRIVEVCKGGVRVNLKGKLAFCPISQIDIKHVENPEEYIGKSFEFQITQFSEGGKNIVVSRRKVLEEERDLNMGSFLEDHQVGDVVEGRVARIEKFGAFLELAPGVDGLIHISEMAWSRVQNPADLVQIGQKVSAKILKKETTPEGQIRIALSLKQVSDGKENSSENATFPVSPSLEDSWSKYTVGQVITGKIIRKELYGFFIQLEPGITGLLHKSKAIDQPHFHFEKLKIGDTVEVQIGEIRKEDHRISLDVPKDPHAEDWKLHQQTNTSFGTLGDQLKSALTKKK